MGKIYEGDYDYETGEPVPVQYEDAVRLTVMRGELTTQTPVVVVNDDDDNQNGTPDNEDPDGGLGVQGYDDLDLTPVDLHWDPNATPDKWVLKATQNGSKLRVWRDWDWGEGTANLVQLPATFDQATVPNRVWLDGLEKSSSVGDVVLELETWRNKVKHTHRLKLTVVRVRVVVTADSAAGQSNKVEICQKPVERVASAIPGGHASDFQPNEGLRWVFYDREREDRKLDCDHRALLAACAFGIVGIPSQVHRVYATCHPVPEYPPDGPNVNTTTNDYVSTYLPGGVTLFGPENRIKRRREGVEEHALVFGPDWLPNTFEGCLRIEDGSPGDGSKWWTVWPMASHDTAKALLKWYDETGQPQQWRNIDLNEFRASEPVPEAHLDNRPTLLDGPG